MVKDADFSWAFRRRKRRHRASGIALFAFMWVAWRERKRRTFQGIEHDFVHLKNNVFSLASFWLTKEIPICIKEECVS